MSIASNDTDENPFDVLIRGDGVDLAPQTLVVGSASTNDDNTDDLNNLTFVAALELANAATDLNNITFSSTLNGVPIVQPREGDGFRINSPVNIQGNGAPATIIEGNNSTVFEIGNNNGVSYTASISGVTIRNGHRGISNDVDLTITDSLITDNTAPGGGGAGISNDENLTLIRTTVSNNTANNGDGGGIFSRGGLLVLTNSTVSGNSAVNGGGIHSQGDVTTLNSTIVDNSATTSAGGIHNDGGTLTIDNTIVAGNEAASTASDIVVNGGSLASGSGNNLIGDPATAGGLVHGTDGNILGDGSGGALALSVIVDALGNNGGPIPTHALASGSAAIDAGDNTAAAALTQDQRQATPRANGTVDIGAFESGSAPPPAEIAVAYPVGTDLTDNNDTIAFDLAATGQSRSLVVTITNAGLSDLTGIAVATSGTDAGDFTIDDGQLATTLSPLASSTFTVTFSPGAAGSKSASIQIASSDADENPFDVSLSGVAIAAPAAALLVDAAGDVNNGDFSTGNLTLREAIVLANLVDDATTITFTSSLDGSPILLGSALDTITQPLTITGNGPAETIIDAQDNGRVLTIDDGETAQIAVTVSDVTIRNGQSSAGENGGGINNAENLTVLRSAIVSNHAQGPGSNGGPFGGGVYSTGTLLIEESTVSGNTTDSLGGGVIVSGDATVRNSTISDNSSVSIGGIGAVAFGGASANLSILNSTIVDNVGSAAPFATFGGLSSFGGAITLHNTLVAGNVENGASSDVVLLSGGSFTAATNNLVGDPNSAGGLVHGTDNNILGDGAGTLLALASIVGDLQDNGGPTLTHAPVENSPAINNGSNAAATALTHDQRGVSPRANGAAVDIGAVEVNANDARTPAEVDLTPGGGDTVISIVGDNLVVTQGSTELLSTPLATLGDLTIDGTTGDDVLAVTGPASGFSGDLIVNGGDGTDTITFGTALDLGDGDVHATAETIIIGANITTTGDQTFSGTALLGANATLTGGTLTFESTVDSESGETNALTIVGNAEFDSTIGATDALSTLSISGSTTLASGTVETSSAQTFTGSVTVASGATVSVEPGGSTNGVVATGGLTLASGSTLSIDIEGTTPGAEHGQVQVTGAVDITDATLALASTATLDVGEEIVLISNDGSDAVTGTFDGIAEGDTIEVNGQQLTVSYIGGDGNDVTLINQVATVDLTSGGGDTEIIIDGTDVVVTQGGTEILRAALADTAELQINGSDGDDNLMITGPASGFNGDLVINPGDGNDTITFTAPVNVGDGNVEVTAETIILGANITTTGTQTFEGTTVLSDEVTLTGSTVTFTSTVDSQSGENNTLNVVGNAIFEAAVGGTDALGFVDISGSTTIGEGTITSTGAQTFDGSVTVDAGASISSLPGDVNSGVLATGGLTLESDSTLEISITGTTPGTGHGQVDVTGTVDVTGGTLDVSSTARLSLGDEIVIINNKGTDAVVGTFDGLPEGSTIERNGQSLTLSYQGGDGNDVTLTNETVSVVLTEGGGATEITDDGNDLIVTQGGVVISRVPLADAGALQLIGSDGDDDLTITGPSSGFNGDLIIAPGEGNDTVTFTNPVDVGDGNVLVTAETIVLGANITTTGDQTFNGNTILDTDVTLTGGIVTFNSQLDSASGETLSLAVQGDAVFNAEAGGTVPLDEIEVTGDTTVVAQISTNGARTFGGSVLFPAGGVWFSLPGDPDDGILDMGGLDADAGSTLNFRIDSPTAGTGHGQFNVTGTVDVTDATLSPFASGAPALGEYVLINNDSDDAVVGTFDGFPEGAIVTVAGHPLRISYVGGDGNDVVLVNETVVTSVPSSADATEVTADGDDIVVTQGGTVISRTPIASATRIEVQGSSGNDNLALASLPASATGDVVVDAGEGDDTLTVDLRDGNPAPGGVVIFNGGADGNDALIVVDETGTPTTIDGSYFPDAQTFGDGEVSFNLVGGGTLTIQFTGLEPTEVSGVATTTLTTPNGVDVISVDAGTGSGSEPAIVTSGTSGGVSFEALTLFDVADYTIDLAANDATETANDSVTINSLAAQGLGSLTINTGSEGIDTVDLAATLTLSGGLTVNGAVISGDGSLDGPLTVGSGSRLAPGDGSVDDLAIGNLSAGSGADLEFSFSGTEADQLLVTGTVDITDATLVTTGTADASTDFVLINNDGTDTETGTFASLAEGAGVTIDGETFEITYVGGDGNDVVLLAAAQTATIQGQYYVDANGNGQFDSELDWYENGVTIELIDDTGTVVDTQVTRALDIDGESGDEVGAYQFEDLPEGAYVVRQVLPTGVVQTVPDFPTTLNGTGSVSGSWDYDDADGNSTPGPATWNTLAPTLDGFFQSPIDISGVPSVDLDSVLDINYEDTTFDRVFNNGHAIEAELPHEHGNSISLGLQGEEFELLQFHFHTPSEHEIDGTGGDVELHLVHQHEDGGLAVIGLLLEASEDASDNTALASVFDAMPSILNNGDEVTITDPIDLNAILPASHDGWYYEGSLTTPPGSQGVNWFVFETPVVISTSQLAAYQAVANHDASHDFDPGNRPVQPLNGRQLNQQNHEVTADGGESYSLNFAAAPPRPVIVVGNESSSGSIARTVDPVTGAEVIRVQPFGDFTGEIRTATGDVNLDGTNDIIVAPGPGGGPRIQVFDGSTGEKLQDFFAYSPAFRGGVYVAAGDVDNDGDVDIITGAGEGGGPHIRAFDAATGERVRNFFAYDTSFTGGVRVAAGDVNGDGYADIIAANGPGASSNVRVFSGADGSQLQSLLAYSASFLGGTYVAAGDINGDGLADIITGAGAGGGPHVRAFSGDDGSRIANFFAYGASDTAGVRVAVSDVTGDGLDDILVNPATSSSNVPRGFDAGNNFAPTDGGLEISSLGRGFYSSAPMLRRASSNSAPELANAIRDQTATTGASFNFTVPADTFRDRDRDDTLTYTATLDDANPLPSWLTFDASTQSFSGSPVAPGDVGAITVRVTVDDNASGTASDDFQLTVRDASATPTTSSLIVIGATAGKAPTVQVIDTSDGSVRHDFYAYNRAFRGGVDVALADVNNDGVEDIITGAGPGGGPHVKVFNGADGSRIASFFPFAVNFTGGVRVAGGDVNGDGYADIITGAGPGGTPSVKVYSGSDLALLHSFDAFSSAFTGGVDVAAGDVTDDGNADIVVAAGRGGGPHVRAFDGTTGDRVLNFFAFNTGFTGGVSVSTADVNGDGIADVITGQATGGGEARIFNGNSGERLGSFSPFGAGYTGGLNVGGTNYDDDLYEDVIVGKLFGSDPHVQIHSGNGLGALDDFFAFDPGFIGGALVD